MHIHTYIHAYRRGRELLLFERRLYHANGWLILLHLFRWVYWQGLLNRSVLVKCMCILHTWSMLAVALLNRAAFFAFSACLLIVFWACYQTRDRTWDVNLQTLLLADVLPLPMCLPTPSNAVDVCITAAIHCLM
jgi:hypothetical protein